jgi:hypothetical protein
VKSSMDMMDSSWVSGMDRTQTCAPQASLASLPESGQQVT